MYYSSGNYEAFARPKKPEGVDHKSAYIVGSGLAALTAACYLVRDGQMKGERIHLLEKLELPYRVIDTAAGDLGTSAARKFDCEAWLPTQQRWMEVTSTSNCTTYQARRLAVRERREKNLTIDELDAYVRSIIQSQCHWFIVDDLNHLKRGGRVSSTAALVGTMLGIKPVMHTDSEGRLTPVSKARGTKAALRALVDKVGEIGVEPAKNQPMLICHANCPESVEYVKGLLKERFGVTDVRDDFIGPVIGAHTGCGTLGLFFVGTER